MHMKPKISYRLRRQFLQRSSAILRPQAGFWRAELPNSQLFGWGDTPHAALTALMSLVSTGQTTL